MPAANTLRASLKKQARPCVPGLLLLAPLAFASCAAPAPGADHNAIVQATIQALPGTDAAAIQISNAERLAAKWTWNASAEGKVYACDADDQLRLPQCIPST